MKKLPLILLVIIATGIFSGCAPKESVLTGEEEKAVLAFSESKTDNLLVGMNAHDYAIFSEDFDEQMLAAMTESQFDALKKERDEKLGLYISREVNRVVQSGDFYAVIYDTVFAKDDAVTVRVVFRLAEPHEISGLWFNK